MPDWRNQRNYRKFKNEDGSFRYVITVDGVDTEVDEVIYRAYSQGDRKERYSAERDTGRTVSLDGGSDDSDLVQCLTATYSESAEDTVIRNMLVDEVLNTLAPEERSLIQAVVMDGVTEQEYGILIGMTQNGVNKRKQRILKKAVLKSSPNRVDK